MPHAEAALDRRGFAVRRRERGGFVAQEASGDKPAIIVDSFRVACLTSNSMRIMVVGGSGYLGGEVVRQAAGAGHDVVATYMSHSAPAECAQWRRMDVTARREIAAVVAEIAPDVVINAAFRQHEWAATAVGPADLAIATTRSGVRLVHVSSDAVFSGRSSQYAEDALPDPITPYGAAKAAAETAIHAIDPHAAIVRTSLIVGDGRSVHERFVRALATGEADGALFTDDVRCPVHVADLASALLEFTNEPVAGVHHVAGADAVSRYELGCMIARQAGLNTAALSTALRADLDDPGPIQVRLDSRRTQARLRTRLRGAREFLQLT